MGLRFDPVGGGQFKQALSQIIESERQPIKQLENRKKVEESKQKLFGEFKGKFTGFERTLAEFASFRSFRELKVDLGDGANHVEISVDKNRAEPGVYQLEVESLAKRSAVISNGFKDADEKNLGIGFVVVYLADGESMELFVDEQNASLRGIATLINQHKDSPVQASVINDQGDTENPWRLILSSRGDGAEKAVDFPELYFLDGDQDIYFAEENDAENAYLKLDGFELEAGSNNINDFLTGVNLKLKQARPDQPITVTITEDTAKISGKVKGMIDQINAILEFINKQNQIDEKTDTRSTFAGDTSLQTIEYRLRNVMHEAFPIGDPDEDDFRLVSGSDFGVVFEKNGQLSFDENKFKARLEKDYKGVSEAITGEFGLANTLRKVIGGYTRQPDGMIGVREKAIQSRIRKIDDDIAGKERRLERKTQSLTEQFSRLQGSLANMQRQGQYLQASMGGGGGNLVSQLLGG